MNVRGEVLVQPFNKSKLSNETKAFQEPNVFSICSQILEIKI